MNTIKSEIKKFIEETGCYRSKTLDELKKLKVEDLWAHKIHVLSYMVGKYQGCSFDDIYYMIYDLIEEEVKYLENLYKEYYKDTKEIK